MYYLLYIKKDAEKIEAEITPLLKNVDFKKVVYNTGDSFPFSENDVVLTYLNDDDLREFLPLSAKGKWQLGILPHPKMYFSASGFGVPQKMEAIVKEIIETDTTHQLDLTYCNDILVFQSANIGEVFELSDDGKSKGGYRQFYRFLKQLRKLRSLKHKPFRFFIKDEKIIDTSAVGILAVEHSKSSLFSKKTVKSNISNDGLVHLLIFSPQNILELVWFFLKSLFPDTLVLKKRPKFIGLIRASEVTIKSTSAINYTIDGKKHEANEINLKVEYQSLTIAHPLKNEQLTNTSIPKSSLFIDNLPKDEKKEELIKRKLPWLRRATFEEFKELFVVLKENAVLTNAYLVMMILSTLITAFGLYADSAPVIIGAMILAPLISPIVSFSMGLIRYDIQLLKTSFKTIVIGTIVSLLFASLVSLIIPLKIETPEISARLTPNLLDLGIAIASGIAAAFAHAKEGIAKSLAGVAIAVALVPPLVVAGVGIGWWNWDVFSGAFLLYLTNLSGIIMFAGLTFLLLGFAPFKTARKGLIYSLLIVALVCIPLTFSFNRIKQEAKITKKLEGYKIDQITLREVRVRFGSPLTVSLKIISPKTISDTDMKEIKHQIEAKVEKKIKLEVSMAIEF